MTIPKLIRLYTTSRGSKPLKVYYKVQNEISHLKKTMLLNDFGDLKLMVVLIKQKNM